MLDTVLIPRVGRLTAALGLAVVAGPVWAQSNASMTTDPGSTIALTVGFEAMTDSGPISGVDTDSTNVEGMALITVFPTEPSFTHCRVHSLTMALGTIELVYLFYTFQATFTDLVIESTGPFDGTIGGTGDVTFATTPLRITGSVHLYSSVFGIDETLPVDATSSEPIGVRLRESAGTVILDEITMPSVDWVVPPELLPAGFSSLNVTVDADASSIVFRGPYAPAVPGDSDADDDLDLADFARFMSCFGGLDQPVDIFCTTSMLDEDNDVDLDDFGEFWSALTGP